MSERPLSLRPAEWAGSYYPREAEVCARDLRAWPALPLDEGRWIGAFVPHGGWRYAGRIATGTLKALASRTEPDLIVVLGGHLDAGEAPRVFIDGDWETPLGPVPTDVRLAEDLAMVLSAEPETAEEYYDDTAVEVLMPMLRWLWPAIPTLVVGLAPDVAPTEVAREIADLTADRGRAHPIVLGAADLTHYGPDHGYRPRGSGDGAHRWVLEDNDARIVGHLEALRHHEISWEGPRLRNTCAPGTAATTVALARRWGAERGVCLAQSTSWLEDGAPPPPRSFIGYAGMVFGS